MKDKRNRHGAVGKSSLERKAAAINWKNLLIIAVYAIPTPVNKLVHSPCNSRVTVTFTQIHCEYSIYILEFYS